MDVPQLGFVLSLGGEELATAGSASSLPRLTLPTLSRAQSLVDGSESGYLCVHYCVVLSKGRIPGAKRFYVAIWIVFCGFSEVFLSLAQNSVKALRST